MSKPNHDGRDEMNLATLPIAPLGRNDTREVIEYDGTFSDGKKQQNMVWTVSGSTAVGLPSEFAERVLVALLYIGSQNDFADRRLEFTPYQILKVLGQSSSGRNYKAVELALTQLHGVSITSDKAWIEKKKDGSQRRVTTRRAFHIIDEFYLHTSRQRVCRLETHVGKGALLLEHNLVWLYKQLLHKADSGNFSYLALQCLQDAITEPVLNPVTERAAGDGSYAILNGEEPRRGQLLGEAVVGQLDNDGGPQVS